MQTSGSSYYFNIKKPAGLKYRMYTKHEADILKTVTNFIKL